MVSSDTMYKLWPGSGPMCDTVFLRDTQPPLLIHIFQRTWREYARIIDYNVKTSSPFGRPVHNVPTIWCMLDVCDKGDDPSGDTGCLF
jgi:hypothetical protein